MVDIGMEESRSGSQSYPKQTRPRWNHELPVSSSLQVLDVAFWVLFSVRHSLYIDNVHLYLIDSIGDRSRFVTCYSVCTFH